MKDYLDELQLDAQSPYFRLGYLEVQYRELRRAMEEIVARAASEDVCYLIAKRALDRTDPWVKVDL